MVSSHLYSPHALYSPSFCQPTLNLNQGDLSVVCVQHSWPNFRLKFPTLNNISNITDYKLFSTIRLHQVLHADIHSDSCMVLKEKFQSCKKQKNPF